VLLLVSTSDKLQVVTGSAVTTDVHASAVDVDGSGVITTYRKNSAITTAVTTDVVVSPGSGVTRNVKTLTIRNKHATSTVDVTVQHTDGTTVVELVKTTLLAGESLLYLEDVGFFKPPFPGVTTVTNQSVANQTGFAADTYLTGSNVTIPTGLPRVGTAYLLKFDMTKTAAGVAAPTLTIRTGTAGTTADTARCTLTLSAGTANADTSTWDVVAYFRTVGSGTSAVLVAMAGVVGRNVTATGISSDLHGATATAAGFDSTTTNLIIGASFNGGTSFSGTNVLVRAQLIG
jgi:hypothetical protein